MASNQGKGAAFGLIRIVVGIAVIALLALGANFLHANSTFLRVSEEDSENLNEIVASGKEFPVGKNVTLEARWPLGEFAWEKSTMNGVTSAQDHYYLVFLEDRTFIAVKLSNTKEIAAVDEQVAKVEKAGSIYTVEGGVKLTGKLKKLTSTKIKGYYLDTLKELDYGENDKAVRLLVLDTTALNTTRILILVGIAAVVIVTAVIVAKKRRKDSQTVSAVTAGSIPEMTEETNASQTPDQSST